MNFGLILELEKQGNLFSSTKSAKLLDHLYVMDNYFFMPLAVAMPNIHLVGKKSFFETLQNSPGITPTL